MEVNSWKKKKVNLIELIKKLSDYYGGDDEAFLKEYCDEIINKHKNNLDVPLNCFIDLTKNL